MVLSPCPLTLLPPFMDPPPQVDASGDGFVTLEELTTAQKQALAALGEPASPWKCYVDPAQSVMCYHNILTDEKVRRQTGLRSQSTRRPMELYDAPMLWNSG